MALEGDAPPTLTLAPWPQIEVVAQRLLQGTLNFTLTLAHWPQADAGAAAMEGGAYSGARVRWRRSRPRYGKGCG